MSHPVYSRQFHLTRDHDTHYAATQIIAILLKCIPPVRSAIDIGCGVGTWCKVLQDNGVLEVKGVDGPWVGPDLLVIPRESFESFDLLSPYLSSRKYDLLSCLEVAEHLPPDKALPFVESLTRVSDFILFSAAVPFQGGQGHQNEQWQSYWGELFGRLDYSPVDVIRPSIWNDMKINFWYRQNVILFVRNDRLGELVIPAVAPTLSLVHPELFLSKCGNTKPSPPFRNLNPLHLVIRYLSRIWRSAKRRLLDL